MIRYFLILSTVTALFSCTKAIIDEEAANGTVQLPETAAYDPDVKNIMQNNCITCHSGGTPAAGVDLTTYSVVKQNTEFGFLQQRMNSATSPMPPSGQLPANQRSIIDKWIQDGYLEN